jgi:hypothetical protein
MLAIAMLVLALAGCAPAGGQDATAGTAIAQPAPQAIPVGALEEQYGVRVNLIAVTAAGGLVDLRLKVVDAGKARQLVKDAASYPALVVLGSDAVLTAPEESRSQVLKLGNGEMIMSLFPNTRSAVKPGAKVAIQFGAMRLEPMVVK